MAYYRRKYTSSRRKPYRRSRKHLSKFMVRAIKAVAAKPVETKRFTTFAQLPTLLLDSGYTAGEYVVIASNIFSPIPRFKNALTRTEDSFVGNEIHARGFKFMMNVYTTTASTVPDIMMRFSIHKRTYYNNANVFQVNAGGQEFDQEFSNIPTQSVWNRQLLSVIYSKKFRLGNESTGRGVIEKKFWVPLRKKVVSSEEEGLLTASYMGMIKGEQYYWALEIWGASQSDLRAAVVGNVSTAVYFKDE